MVGRKKIHRSRPLRRLRCALRSSGASAADWDAADGISLRVPPPARARARVTVTAAERRRAALNRARAARFLPAPSRARDRCNALAIEWPCHVHARCNFFATPPPSVTVPGRRSGIQNDRADITGRQSPCTPGLRPFQQRLCCYRDSFFFIPDIFFLSTSRIRYVTSSSSRVTRRVQKERKAGPSVTTVYDEGTRL